MVEMHVQRSERQLVVLVIGGGKALGELPGVSVDSVRIGSAEVSYQPDQVSPEQIVLTIEDVGYSAQAKG